MINQINQYVQLGGKHYVVRQGNLEGAIEFQTVKEARIYQAVDEIHQLNYLMEQAASALKALDVKKLEELKDYLPPNIMF